MASRQGREMLAEVAQWCTFGVTTPIDPMALNIKNVEVERLADQIAKLTGETKTEAIRQALVARRDRLTSQASGLNRTRRLAVFLESRAWPQLRGGAAGRPVSKKERERILGYGSGGV